MEGKYFFNNKDITMNLCIQIRDVIDIIKRIRLCRILKIRFGRSQQDISQIGSMKSRNRKNYRQSEIVQHI